MAEEIFDVCDENDTVIGQETRSKVHSLNLLHRAVHIWVFNTSGKLLIHRRTHLKDQYPRCFTSSASGHVDAGESYEEAAIRELREELQLAGDLEFATKIPASPETAYEHSVLYFLYSDVPPTPDVLEIESLHFLDPDEIRSEVKSHPENFTPPFRELFQWWMSQRKV